MLRDDSDRLQSWHDRFSELGIDAPLSQPVCFKKALHIGEDAYTSLAIKRRALKLLGPVGAAVAGAAVASSELVARIFFGRDGPFSVLIDFLFGRPETPIPWVIATAVLFGIAWAVINRMLDDASAKRVDQVPKFINTPLDHLAVSIFGLICPLALKIAAADGEIDARERAEIARYFVGTWGYDEEFVKAAVDIVSECEYTFDDLVRNLVEFTRSNPDCNAQAISQNVLVFLNEVAEASNGIAGSERVALLEAERAFALS